MKRYVYSYIRADGQEIDMGNRINSKEVLFYTKEKAKKIADEFSNFGALVSGIREVDENYILYKGCYLLDLKKVEIIKFSESECNEKIGKRVKCLGLYDIPKGIIGKVIEFDSGTLCIKWDKPIASFDLNHPERELGWVCKRMYEEHFEEI